MEEKVVDVSFLTSFTSSISHLPHLTLPAPTSQIPLFAHSLSPLSLHTSGRHGKPKH